MPSGVPERGRVWTIRVRKGIRFADDPVFVGKPRELVAQDYVYSITRSLDPNLGGGGDPDLTELIAGARPVVDAARKPGAKLDYDAPIAGLRALDRYTLQIKLTRPDYMLLDRLAQLPACAVAREAIEAAGSQVMTQPVGTGSYRLAEWKRGSKVVLEANPHYRTLEFPRPTTDEQARAGRLMMFNLGARSLDPTGYQILSLLYGKSSEDTNFARFKLVAYDDAYEAFLRMPDGPQRTALARRMSAGRSVRAVVRPGLPDRHVFVQPWAATGGVHWETRLA